MSKPPSPKLAQVPKLDNTGLRIFNKYKTFYDETNDYKENEPGELDFLYAHPSIEITQLQLNHRDHHLFSQWVNKHRQNKKDGFPSVWYFAKEDQVQAYNNNSMNNNNNGEINTVNNGKINTVNNTVNNNKQSHSNNHQKFPVLCVKGGSHYCWKRNNFS